MPDEERTEEEIHLYENAGIRERRGRVPLWLVAVSVGLLAWGAYYIVANWSPPP